MLRNVTAAAAALLVSATVAHAAEINPAVVFDMGGKFDKSFNEGVYNGVEQFKKETGIEYREFEVTNETQREQAIRRMVDRGATVVLEPGVGQDRDRPPRRPAGGGEARRTRPGSRAECRAACTPRRRRG